jgi:hypothetical protein
MEPRVDTRLDPLKAADEQHSQTIKMPAEKISVKEERCSGRNGPLSETFYRGGANDIQLYSS